MARKLNKKFVLGLIGAGILAAGGVVGGIYGKELFRPSIASLEKQGDAAIAAGDFEQAQLIYGRIAARAQTDIRLQIKFVDAFEYVVQGDPERMRLLRGYYTSIFQADPRNVDIMRRILRLQENDVRGNPGSRPSVRALIQTADGILAREPKDREARKAKVIAALEPFQRRMETDPEEVNAARILAEELYSEDPNDGEAISMVMRFRLQEAQDAFEQRNAPALKSALESAKKFVDDAMAKTPENGEAYFAAYSVYRSLSRMLPGPDIDVAKRLELAKQADGLLDRTDQLAKAPIPDDRLVNIRWYAIRSVQLHDRDLAEKRYRQALEEMPNSRMPRLMLAQFLAAQPNRREEAIAILTAPFQPKATLPALDSMEQHNVEFQEKLRLQVIRLSTMESIADEKERQKRLAEVEEDFKTIVAVPSPSTMVQAWMRRIEAGIASEQDRQSEAVEKLDAALKLMSEESASGSEQELYNETLFEYSIAHMKIGNTGRARPALIKLVQRDPLNIPARIRLLDILIAERNGLLARDYLEDMKRLINAGPMIEQFEVRIAALSADQLRAKYKTMSETTRDQRLLKINAANTLGETDEVIRISRDLIAADPADKNAAMALIRGLMRKGDAPAAMAAVDAAIKVAPTDADLLAMKQRLGATTVEAQNELIEEQINGVENPFHREMLRAELYRSRNQLDDAIAATRKAQALDPASVEALDAEFGLVVQQKKYAEAEAMLPKFETIRGDPAGNELRRIRLSVAHAEDDQSPEKRNAMLLEALERAAKMSQQYNDLAAPSLLYAQLLHKTQRFDEAAEQYSQTLDKSPMNIDALRGIVRCLIATNRIEEARKRLEEGRNKAPTDLVLRELALNLEINYGDPTNAIDPLTSVRDKNPDRQQAWLQLGIALEQVARVKGEKGEPIVAKQYLDRANELWVKALEKFPGDLEFSARLADIRRRQGDAAAAEKIIETLTKDPANANKPEVFELLAEQYVRSGKMEKAVEVLKALVDRTTPPPTSSLLRLSLLYIQLQRPEDALKELDKAPEDPIVQRQRIELLIALNNLPAARTAIEQSIAKSPTADLYVLGGFVELRASDMKKADELLAKALAARPGDPAALFYRSQVRLNSNPPNVEGARQDLLQVIQVSPRNVEARLSLADLLSRGGDRQGALIELEKAWQVNRDRSAKPVLMRLLSAYLTAMPVRTLDAQRTIESAKESADLAADPEVLMAEASLLLAKGDTPRSIEIAQRAVKASPAMTRGYFQLLLEAKAYRQIITEADTALQKDRTQWWASLYRGRANNRLSQRAESAKDFDNALATAAAAHDAQAISTIATTISQEVNTADAIRRIEPLAKSDNDSRFLLASLLLEAKDPGKAIVELERLRADRQRINPPAYRQILTALAAAYLTVAPRQPAEALAVYEEMLRDQPDDMSVLNNMANIYIMPGSTGSLQKALEYSAKAAAIAESLPVADGRVPYIQDTYGWLLIQSGKVDDGMNILQKVADRARFPDLFLHLSEGYLQQDNLERAENALKTAGELISKAEADKEILDEGIRPKFDQLSDQIANKRKSLMGVAK